MFSLLFFDAVLVHYYFERPLILADHSSAWDFRIAELRSLETDKVSRTPYFSAEFLMLLKSPFLVAPLSTSTLAGVNAGVWSNSTLRPGLILERDQFGQVL